VHYEKTYSNTAGVDQIALHNANFFVSLSEVISGLCWHNICFFSVGIADLAAFRIDSGEQIVNEYWQCIFSIYVSCFIEN
jgi:hypothetical protein